MTVKQVGAPAPVPETEAKKSTRRDITLGELGPRLPIGINGNKDFTSRPMKTADERAIGKLVKPNMTMGEYVTLVVGQMCQNVGGVVLEEKKDSEKKFELGRMYFGDVMYVYSYLRVANMGKDLSMEMTCSQPGCGETFKWFGDLESLDVSTVEDASEVFWSFTLRNPITLRNKSVTSLRLGPALWGRIAKFRGNAIELKLEVATASICGLNDEPGDVELADFEIDELSKYDFERLQAEYEKRHIGPKMLLEGSCPKCEKRFKQMIDWSYNSFFGSSSG